MTKIEHLYHICLYLIFSQSSCRVRKLKWENSEPHAWYKIGFNTNLKNKLDRLSRWRLRVYSGKVLRRTNNWIDSFSYEVETDQRRENSRQGGSRLSLNIYECSMFASFHSRSISSFDSRQMVLNTTSFDAFLRLYERPNLLIGSWGRALEDNSNTISIKLYWLFYII